MLLHQVAPTVMAKSTTLRDPVFWLGHLRFCTHEARRATTAAHYTESHNELIASHHQNPHLYDRGYTNWPPQGLLPLTFWNLVHFFARGQYNYPSVNERTADNSPVGGPCHPSLVSISSSAKGHEAMLDPITKHLEQSLVRSRTRKDGALPSGGGSEVMRE